MTEPYVVEPPEPRRREMATDRKLDRIIDLLTHHEEDEPEGDGAPQVTFEPDPDQLPTDPGGDEPEGEGGEDGEGAEGQGEGTANVAEPQQPRRFRFPGAPARVIER